MDGGVKVVSLGDCNEPLVQKDLVDPYRFDSSGELLVSPCGTVIGIAPHATWNVFLTIPA